MAMQVVAFVTFFNHQSAVMALQALDVSVVVYYYENLLL